MRAPMIASLVLLVSHAAVAAELSSKAEKRISESAAVLDEAPGNADQDIPMKLWRDARCVVVVPSVKKAAFVVGGEYGAGLMSCRSGQGWSAPVFMKLAKGSWGFQAGAQSSDLILLVMNERGMEKLLGDKVTLGTDASIAAGPVGRNAAAGTDIRLHAQILTYSHSRGVFGGIDLSGGTLSPDKDDTRDLYGSDVKPADVIRGQVAPPAAAKAFTQALQRRDQGGRRAAG